MGDYKAQCIKHFSIVIFNWVCNKVYKVYILVMTLTVMMMIMVTVVMMVTVMMMH